MHTQQHEPSKRIPKSIGTDTKLFGRYTLTDLIVALVPGVTVILLVQMVVPQDVTVLGYPVQLAGLPLALLAIAVGGLFVTLTPTYTTSLEWLTSFASYHLGSTDADHHEAREQTRLERLHPDRDAIERIDGTLVGFVRVEPPSMALATDAQWRATADAFADFLNTTVEFPIQLYSTTSAFPIDEHLSHYRDRLDDPDVEANPRLHRLIEQYVEWYDGELDRRRMTIRDHYVVVTVAPSEVRYAQESLGHRLGSLPILGGLLGIWTSPPETVARERMFDELDDRCRRVERGLREIDGCHAARIATTDALSLLRSFWTGHDHDGEDALRIRSSPVLGGQR